MTFRTLIAPEQLATYSRSQPVVVVDCRFSLADPDAGRRTYAGSHLPGAVYADLNRDLSSPHVAGETGRHPLPEPTAFAATLGAWGIGAESQVVAYDDGGGVIAARLWWMLRWLGHDAVAVLDGGFSAWLAAGYEQTAAVPTPPPTTFVPHVRSELVVSAADVAACAEDDDWRLFDARERARFAGDVEPIDPVRGHIPGARSLPFSENLEEGCFLRPERLRARFAEALGDVPAERSIAYCGSGVTACHDILAAAHAGYHGMKLYAGSWSEWITDPTRPVVSSGS